MENNKTNEFYREQINKLVYECNNTCLLNFIYKTILAFKKKWSIYY